MGNLLSLPEILENSYKENPTQEAVFDGLHRVTYQRLYNEAHAISSALSQLGIEKGDKVIVSLPNWYECVSIYFGLAQLGAILVPCNTGYQDEELIYILENSEAKATFIAGESGKMDFFKHQVQNGINKNRLKHIITVRSKEDGYFSYKELIEMGKKMQIKQTFIDPAVDLFSILYTSGTTGKPKGTMLTHENVIYTAVKSAEALMCTKEDVFLVAVPAFHVFGMVPGILSAICTGAKIVFMERFKAVEVLHLVETEKITVHHGVPTMFILELNHPDFNQFDLSSLRTGIIAAAPCPEEIVRSIRTKMGCNVIVSYGLTESSAGATFTSFEDDDYVRSNTVGKVVEGTEAKVVDSQNRMVTAGEVGELALRGKGIMKGYYQMPDKTIEAMDEDGWFYTGDLVTINENGYIRVVGRKKDMIIRGGFNIYPREVEEHFYKHPSVLEVAMIGLPDTVLGEISCAVIKLKPGHLEDEKSMKSYIENRVVHYKVPDRIVFLDELPMTASGKISKVSLEKVMREQLKSTLR